MKKLLLLVFSVLILSGNGMGQQSIVLEDLSEILDQETSTLLEDQLYEQGFSLVYAVDFRVKCDYVFAKITPEDNGYLLQMESCRQEVLGSKKLGQDFFEQDPLNSTKQLANYLIILSGIESTPLPARSDSSYTTGASVSVDNRFNASTEPFPSLANEHNSRYYFSPSAYNLRKNEFYYNTLNFVIHDIQYGFTDNFSMGLGSSVAFIPIYVTPKLSFELGEKHHLAIGDLFAYGSWGLNNYFNLAYVAYTYGGLTDNVTIGAGMLNTDFVDDFGSKPIVSLSGMTSFGRRLSFVTEHYFVPSINDEYSTLLIGFLGIRFVSKNQDTQAFQFGVGYLVDAYEFDPSFYLIPTMNFTYKFGRPID